jgi:hypothetical protein
MRGSVSFQFSVFLILTGFVVMKERRERETREISETRENILAFSRVSLISLISRVSRSLLDIGLKYNHKNR